MTFEKEKKECLARVDKSKKGCFDDRIVSLLNMINKLDDFFTTSSCSGRVLILVTDEHRKKKDVQWAFSSHEPVDFEQVKQSMSNLQEAEEVYFKFDAFILHVAARSLDDAGIFLEACHKAGLKRAGIISFSPRFLIEVYANLRLTVPVIRRGKLLVTNDYLETLVEISNGYFEKNFKYIERLKKEISVGLP